MEKEDLIEKIKSESRNGKISCRQALRLASEKDVSPKELGSLLDELGIKIATCQLGCFP
jgi:LAO/AO transport system kinase